MEEWALLESFTPLGYVQVGNRKGHLEQNH